MQQQQSNNPSSGHLQQMQQLQQMLQRIQSQIRQTGGDSGSNHGPSPQAMLNNRSSMSGLPQLPPHRQFHPSMLPSHGSTNSLQYPVPGSNPSGNGPGSTGSYNSVAPFSMMGQQPPHGNFPPSSIPSQLSSQLPNPPTNSQDHAKAQQAALYNNALVSSGSNKGSIHGGLGNNSMMMGMQGSSNSLNMFPHQKGQLDTGTSRQPRSTGMDQQFHPIPDQNTMKSSVSPADAGDAFASKFFNENTPDPTKDMSKSGKFMSHEQLVLHQQKIIAQLQEQLQQFSGGGPNKTPTPGGFPPKSPDPSGSTLDMNGGLSGADNRPGSSSMHSTSSSYLKTNMGMQPGSQNGGQNFPMVPPHQQLGYDRPKMSNSNMNNSYLGMMGMSGVSPSGSDLRSLMGGPSSSMNPNPVSGGVPLPGIPNMTQSASSLQAQLLQKQNMQKLQNPQSQFDPSSDSFPPPTGGVMDQYQMMQMQQKSGTDQNKKSTPVAPEPSRDRPKRRSSKAVTGKSKAQRRNSSSSVKSDGSRSAKRPKIKEEKMNLDPNNEFSPDSIDNPPLNGGATFEGGWQSNNDMPNRRLVIVKIVNVIKQMRPDADKMSQKLPIMARKLEEHLYRSAKTKEEYINSTTLKKRLQMIARAFNPDSSVSGGKRDNILSNQLSSLTAAESSLMVDPGPGSVMNGFQAPLLSSVGSSGIGGLSPALEGLNPKDEGPKLTGKGNNDLDEQRGSHRSSVNSKSKGDNTEKSDPSLRNFGQDLYGNNAVIGDSLTSDVVNNTWQSPTDDMQDRRLLTGSILDITKKNCSDSEQNSQKLPVIAKLIEEVLYRSAKTRDEYTNFNTLRQRLQIVARSLVFKYTATDNNLDPFDHGVMSSLSQLSGDISKHVNHKADVAISELVNSSSQASFNPSSNLNQMSMQQGSDLFSSTYGVGPKENQSGNSAQSKQYKLLREKQQKLHMDINGKMKIQAQNGSSQSNFEHSHKSSQAVFQQLQQSLRNGNNPLAPPIPEISRPVSSSKQQSAQRKREIKQQQQRLLLLRHASRCTAGPSCKTQFCPQMVELWKHMKECTDKNCQTSHCLSSRCVLNHYRSCKAEKKTATCEVCSIVTKQSKLSQSQTDGDQFDMLNNTDVPRGGGADTQAASGVNQFDAYMNANNVPGGSSPYLFDNHTGVASRSAQEPTSFQMQMQFINQQSVMDRSKLLNPNQQNNTTGNPEQNQAQKLQQQQFLMKELQRQRNQLQEQQKQLQQLQKQVVPGSLQAKQLDHQHSLLLKLQQQFQRQQHILQQELRRQHIFVQNPGESDQIMKNEEIEDKKDEQQISPQTKTQTISNEQKNEGSKENSVPTPSSLESDNTGAAKDDAAQQGESSVDADTSLVPSMSSENIRKHIDSLDESKNLSSRRIAQKCIPVIDKLLNDKYGWVFRDPVDPVELGIPDYFDVVKHPMDLCLVKRKLENGEYNDLATFAYETKLIFENAILYNGEKSDVGHMAKTLIESFTKDYEALLNSLKPIQSMIQKSGDYCILCSNSRRQFEPTVLLCNGSCGFQRIRRNATYYTDQSKQNHWCGQCYSKMRDTEPILLDDGNEIKKKDLQQLKNDALAEEAWVQCDNCSGWVHQICALFNGRKNKTAATYSCPSCNIRSRNTYYNTQPMKTAKDLPKNSLSEALEKRIMKTLEEEYRKAAEHLNCNVSSLEKVPDLHVRVVSNIQKNHHVRDLMYKRYTKQGCVQSFPVKTKCILMFQTIHGVDVLLFGMYVYEYDHSCPPPNRRRVYISYIDSAQFFQPRRYRTPVYQSIVIGYLNHVKERGFHTVHIWSCPPAKGDDYIFYCRPAQQKTPDDVMLRRWYHEIFGKAMSEGVINEVSNLYDEYFKRSCYNTDDPLCIPYFEGDYVPGELENIIKDVNTDEKTKYKDMEYSPTPTKDSTNKPVGKKKGTRSNPGELVNQGKDKVMLRFSQTLSNMKDNFIVLLLRSREFIQAVENGENITNWTEELDQMYLEGAERKGQDPEANEKNPLIGDTSDKDALVESEFFDTRQQFLNYCQANHFQFDEARRAKHTTMMILYQLHNPTAPKFLHQCGACYREITHGIRFHCNMCSNFDLCQECYRPVVSGLWAKHDGRFAHDPSHKFMPINLESSENSPQSVKDRARNIKEHLELLSHAVICTGPPGCTLTKCQQMKLLFGHLKTCKVTFKKGCKICVRFLHLLSLHAKQCNVRGHCIVPCCDKFRERHLRLRQQQQLMDDRRRAAQNQRSTTS